MGAGAGDTEYDGNSLGPGWQSLLLKSIESSVARDLLAAPHDVTLLRGTQVFKAIEVDVDDGDGVDCGHVPPVVGKTVCGRVRRLQL